jgi:hypothetical protein
LAQKSPGQDTKGWERNVNERKEKLGKAAPPPTRSKSGEATEHFILWAKDGGRIAEVEVPSFRPRAEVLLWDHRVFIWHDKTRRYVEGISFVVPQAKQSGKGRRPQEQLTENSFQFDSDD